MKLYETKRAITLFLGTVLISSGMVFLTMVGTIDYSEFTDPIIGMLIYLSLTMAFIAYGFIYYIIAIESNEENTKR